MLFETLLLEEVFKLRIIDWATPDPSYLINCVFKPGDGGRVLDCKLGRGGLIDGSRGPGQIRVKLTFFKSSEDQKRSSRPYAGSWAAAQFAHCLIQP